MSFDIYTGTYGRGTDVVDSNTENTRYIKFWDINNDLSGRLYKFPGCCGYAIYTSVNKSRIEGVTEAIKSILESNQKNSHGFGAVQCTVVGDKHREELERCGWKRLSTFVNYGSGNTIYTYEFKL